LWVLSPLESVKTILLNYIVTAIAAKTILTMIIERRSCWCILFIDNGTGVEAKIIHTGRGKFKILEDNCKERYINRIVDASDVVRCKVEPAAHI
jgi:hypothetical protein